MGQPAEAEPSEPSPTHPKRLANPEAKRPKCSFRPMDMLLEAAWFQGAWIIRGGSNHFKIYDATEEHIVHIPSTPSDVRTVKNKRAQLKRAGIDPNKRK